MENIFFKLRSLKRLSFVMSISLMALFLAHFGFDFIFRKNIVWLIKVNSSFEKVKISLSEQMRIAEIAHSQSLRKEEETLNRVLELLVREKEKVGKAIAPIKKRKTQYPWTLSWMGEFYYENSQRVDEGIIHFNRLMDKFITLKKRGGLNLQEGLYREIEKSQRNLSYSLSFLQRKGQTQLKRIYRYLDFIHFIFFISFGFIFIVSFFSLYRPWKKIFNDFFLERKKLKKSLAEIELKGSTYSWELNYTTKEVRRSKLLSSLFNIEQDDLSSYLYDEIGSFTNEGRRNFLEALEFSVSKKAPFHVIVDMVVLGKKYWLEYSATPKYEKDIIWISGSVRNVTDSRVAEKRFNLLFENLDTPAVIFGDAQIMALNKKACAFFGVEDEKELKYLHLAVLFPLYQKDGTSSLEKLSQCMEKMKEGETIVLDYFLRTLASFPQEGRKAKIIIFNIPFLGEDLHLMMISDCEIQSEFEERIVQANRMAQYYRREKIETIYKMGMMIQESIDCMESMPKAKTLSEIKDHLHLFWLEQRNKNIEDGYGRVIFNFIEILSSLKEQWEKKAIKGGNHLSVRENFEHAHYRGDILKMRGILSGVLEDALKVLRNSSLQVTFSYDVRDSGLEYMKCDFYCLEEGGPWPQKFWKELSLSPETLGGEEFLSPHSIYNMINFLGGEMEVILPTEKRGGRISLSFSLESIFPRQVKEEKVVPYGQNKLSATDIWSHFGGDWKSIELAIRDFIAYYPYVLRDFEYFLSRGDGEGVYKTANEFYGVLTYFPFFSSLDRVLLIREYALSFKWTQLQGEIKILKNELEDFSKALKEFLSGQKQKMVG